MKHSQYQNIKFPFLLFLLFLYNGSCQKDTATIVWEKTIIPTDNTLRKIHFSDSDNGWIVGGNTWERGIALYTQDGGKTWRKDSLQHVSLYGLALDTEGVSLATGYSGQVFKKSANDTAYLKIGHPNFYWARDIASYSLKKDGYISVGGEGWVGGKIIKVAPNGTFSIDTTYKQEWSAVCYSDDSTVHVVGYGQIVRSTNGGKTWQLNAAKDDFFQSVCFPSRDIGYIVGLNGSILKTIDRGVTWRTLRNGNSLANKSYPFRAVFFSDILRGYIVGNDGVFFQTKDGGETWEEISGMPEINLLDVFVIENEGWIVGENGYLIKFKL